MNDIETISVAAIDEITANNKLLKASREFNGTKARSRVFTALGEYLQLRKSGSLSDLRKTLMRYCFVNRDRAEKWIDELLDMEYIHIDNGSWYYNE